MFRQVGLFAFAVLSALGCAKGIEIVPGEDVILISLPDAGRRDAGSGDLVGSGGAGSELGDSTSDASPSTASNAGGSAGASGATMTSGGAAGDSGAGDAGRAEDRPADAGD